MPERKPPNPRLLLALVVTAMLTISIVAIYLTVKS